MAKAELEFVVSGISGRFPKASNLEEYWNNLIRGTDMIAGQNGPRVGKVNQFDAEYFGMNGTEVGSTDPRLRFALELVYEAIVDAGVNPGAFYGTNTGVFVGASGEESGAFAKRISAVFDLTGPSQSAESGYADSSVALVKALQSLRNGTCESAIVTGLQINQPGSEQLQVSPDGKCKAFDASADGVVWSEGAAAIYICKKDAAKRQYATIAYAKVNEEKVKQEKFLSEFYQEAQSAPLVPGEDKVSPLDVAYVEANGVGIKEADEEEASALAKTLCEGRDGPLIIGSVKGSLGHAGSAAGIAGLAKILLSHHFSQIPPTLNVSTPNPDIPALADGRLQVVMQRKIWSGKYAALNSIAPDGTGVHVLLKLAPKDKALLQRPPIPILVPISGRTKEAVDYHLKQIQTRVRNNKFVGLVHQVYGGNIQKHPFRGYTLSSATETKSFTGTELPVSKSELWFVFTGLGNQWVGMIRDMVRFKVFNDSIQKSASILKERDYDLLQVLNSTDPKFLEHFKNAVCCITATQIALVDLFRAVGVVQDGIIGYSTGECCSGYADGAFTHEQSLLVSFSRVRALSESNLPPGVVAAVKLSWEQCVKRCPKGVYPAIHNSEAIVSIGGPPTEVRQFMAKLSSEGIFAKEVQSAAHAFHTPHVAGSAKLMRELLSQVIVENKPRSKKWLSTSIPADQWGSELAKYSSVDYHVNNALSPVFFYATLKHIPKNSIVVEMGPHGFMQSVLRQAVVAPALITYMMDNEEKDNTAFFLNSLGQIYLRGRDMNLSGLYEPVSFPVDAGTPVLSPMIQWDHKRSWPVPQAAN